MKIINPANHELIDEIAEDNNASIEAKFQRAQAARSSWSALSLKTRIEIIGKFHNLLDEHKGQISLTLTQEVGKPLPESLNEINGARSRIRFFLENSSKWLEPQEVNLDGNTTEKLSFDPLGIVCNISAWNYPYLVGVNVFIPALIAGNCVLYKPSEYASLTGKHIERLLHLAGVPTDVFQAIIGGASVGAKLLELPCDGYFFTGSYATGKLIAEKVAAKLVPIGLELGGKDPLYVTDQVADLAQVAQSVAEGCFYNNGQSCCAVERVYVHEKIYDQFIEKFVKQTQALSQLGAVTRTQHLDFLESQVQDALEKGAKLLTGGKRTGKGNFFPATILTDVTHEMSLMREETFGPLIGVMKVSNDQEAINLMNDTNFGLTASVYSQDTERAKKILTQIDSGSSYVNCCDRISPYLPWSGRKNSGLGSTLSYLGILAFAKPRGWHLREDQ